MPALVAADAKLTVTDLVIHEFDQWSNAQDAMLAPTTICTCRQDLAAEAAE
jgi:hypothetical protein